MQSFFRKYSGVVLIVSAVALSLATSHRAIGQSAASSKRETIGEVLGKAIYRDEINTSRNARLQDELFRLFLYPVTQRYCEAHKAEIEPTQAEIDMVAAFFKKNGFEGDDADEPTAAELRLQLKDVEIQLSAKKLSERRRFHFKHKKKWIEQQLDDMPTRAETFITAAQNLLNTLKLTVLAIEMRAIETERVDPDLTKKAREELLLQLAEVEEQFSERSFEKELSEARRDYVKFENKWIEQCLNGVPTHVEKYIVAVQSWLDDFNGKVDFEIMKRMIDEELASTDLTKKEREEFEDAKKIFELARDPEQMFAIFILSQWKFERHLYGKFGGGRILWQQAGLEAFDANRRWLEAEEKNGKFKITDPKLRKAFYRYWTQSHGPYMIEDEASIRQEFLEPKWAPHQAK